MNNKPLSFLLAALSVVANVGAIIADTNAPTTYMCKPGKLIFADEFSKGSISPRWFFRKDWIIKDGALIRNELSPDVTRVFLKDSSIANAIIQFDFCFKGAKEIRMMTGANGNYNAVVILRLPADAGRLQQSWLRLRQYRPGTAGNT